MAGFWNKSQSQIQDVNGKPMVGAKAYFYLGGTTTPISVYGAYALGLINKLPNPVVSDGNGFFPSVFFDEADGFYHLRMTTSGGVVILDVDGLPIIGPSGGGGGGGDNPVNPDAVLSTGDMKARYGTGFLSGFVRVNARTIGSAISGATERANADTQALFEYLWNTDTTLVVVGGRGATSSADWSANKQITLPDARSRTLIGMDDMGNTAVNLIPQATVLGGLVGEAVHALIANEMPSHTHTGTTGSAGDHVHGIRGNVNTNAGLAGLRAGDTPPSATVVQNTEVAGAHVHPLSIDNAGGGLAHNNTQPSMAITIYMRL
ncbi:hypothetical protein [Rhizobium tubonense]|uniref:Phage tail collar domain-containing protein n=1 Tax=Rhizobium tubonense TaxID=484088 RepID=A0A2W4E6V4_9HYPH|nr:hypothetical protein [Rhizobium tubonense]PZM07580.1 hypothetical protein CPY51_31105 [Rhizobium tubonense]